MNEQKKKRLEQAGWRVGSAQEFLGLTPEEANLVNIRLALAKSLVERRTRLKLTQTDLAHRLGSSQSRIAKMEAGKPEVSIDLLVRGMLATGAEPKEVGDAISIGWIRLQGSYSHRTSIAPRKPDRSKRNLFITSSNPSRAALAHSR